MSPIRSAGREPTRARSSSLVAAAATSVLVTVGLDLAGGAGPTHVAVLGTLATLLAAVRLRRPGRHRALFGVLSAALVLPAALHLFGEAAHSSGPHLDAGHGLATTSITAAASTALAAAIAAAVGAAEWLFDQLGRATARMVLLVAGLLTLPAPRRRRSVPSFPGIPVPRVRPGSGTAAQRGPPRGRCPAS